MKKRSYKREQNRLYREIKRRIAAEARIDKAEEEAKYYKNRFREFGSNVETIEPGSGTLQMLKWQLKAEAWGQYIRLDDRIVEAHDKETIQKIMSEEIVRKIAEGLIERNLVQFLIKDPVVSDPLNRYGTYAAKLYVVPWEQVPHRKIIEVVTDSPEFG